MARMLRANIKQPINIVLLTDQHRELDFIEGIDRILPCPEDPEGLAYVSGPNCFKRLRFFDEAYSRQFGTEWVASIDLDTVILNDMSGIVDYALRQEFGLCILKSKQTIYDSGRPYNGALYFIRVGSHQYLWDTFDGVNSQNIIREAGCIGSDQCWISMNVEGAPLLGIEHGVYFKGDYRKRSDNDPLPVLINFAGQFKPWSKTCMREDNELWQAYQHYHQGQEAGHYRSSTGG